jgi:hypothetical protein
MPTKCSEEMLAAIRDKPMRGQNKLRLARK